MALTSLTGLNNSEKAGKEWRKDGKRVKLRALGLQIITANDVVACLPLAWVAQSIQFIINSIRF